MVRKTLFLVGLGTGYVLGARAGRERYDQILDAVQQMWRDPRVQEGADRAQDVVHDTAEKTRVAIKAKVASGSSSGSDRAKENNVSRTA